ncbi:MAG: folate-binding protein [Opitutae bacterium]|nr:folate-binding protein [Opitutae bacterium]
MLAGAHLYDPSATLCINGPDAYSFLQGQFTNDLNRPAGSATYGLWLNQKGKVLADSVVLRRAADDFLVFSQFSAAAEIRQRLEAYLIADEVTVQDQTAAWGAIELWGPRAGQIVETLGGAVPTTGAFSPAADGAVIFRGRTSRENGFTVLSPAAHAPERYRRALAAGAVEADAGTAALARITGRLPAVPADLGPGELPNEGGLEDVAISFTKGCYLGQEVMARLKNLGQVRRRLHVVEGPGPAPAPGGEIFQHARRVGEFRSAARRGEGFVGFALLSLLRLDSTAALSRSPESAADIRIVPAG